MTRHLSLMRLLYHCTIPAMMNSPSHVICSLSIVCTTIVYLPPLVMNVLCLYLCYHNTYEMCFWHCNTNRTPQLREIFCNRLQGALQLHNDYFSDNPIYPDHVFCRRFRMRKHLFLKIVDAVVQENIYFVQRRDAAGRLGFLPIQKVTAAFRLLAYSYSADSIDEYL